MDWYEFKDKCLKMFGAEVSQLIDDLLSWHPNNDELAEDFIIRVEE